MEDDLGCLSAFAHAIGMAGGCLNGDDAEAIIRLAEHMKDLAADIEARREKLFHMLHTRRHEPDFDDGSGEVEEAAGEMGGDHD